MINQNPAVDHHDIALEVPEEFFDLDLLENNLY